MLVTVTLALVTNIFEKDPRDEGEIVLKLIALFAKVAQSSKVSTNSFPP